MNNECGIFIYLGEIANILESMFITMIKLGKEFNDKENKGKIRARTHKPLNECGTCQVAKSTLLTRREQYTKME